MGRPGIRSLKTRMGGSAALADEWLDYIVEVCMSEESEERVIVLRVETQQGGSSKSESCQDF